MRSKTSKGFCAKPAVVSKLGSFASAKALSECLPSAEAAHTRATAMVRPTQLGWLGATELAAFQSQGAAAAAAAAPHAA